MAKKKQSKPTMKDVESVISSLIREVDAIGRNLYEINSSFSLYLDWKKEKDKFKKFVDNEVQRAQEAIKINEDRIKTKEKVDEPGETK